MKRTIWFLTVISILALVVSACSPKAAPIQTATAPPANGSGTAGNEVKIEGFAFSPSQITVKAGTTITWTNLDSAGHTVVSDTGVFESANLAQGDTFSFTFNTAGTFPYHCGVHASMKGTVIVTQ
jgi:plastocyanin